MFFKGIDKSDKQVAWNGLIGLYEAASNFMFIRGVWQFFLTDNQFFLAFVIRMKICRQIWKAKSKVEDIHVNLLFLTI